jgi:hypothetical protein
MLVLDANILIRAVLGNRVRALLVKYAAAVEGSTILLDFNPIPSVIIDAVRQGQCKSFAISLTKENR